MNCDWNRVLWVNEHQIHDHSIFVNIDTVDTTQSFNNNESVMAGAHSHKIFFPVSKDWDRIRLKITLWREGDSSYDELVRRANSILLQYQKAAESGGNVTIRSHVPIYFYYPAVIVKPSDNRFSRMTTKGTHMVELLLDFDVISPFYVNRGIGGRAVAIGQVGET